MDIGIERNQALVYEGTGRYGRAVWPSPIVTPAKIVFESEGALEAEKMSASVTSSCRFREDYYDPISRIRRGRFYFADGMQPNEWHVQPHPALPYEMRVSERGEIRKQLETFYGNPIWHRFFDGREEQPLVLLGLDNRFTIWTFGNVEAISTGEDLATLRARYSFGFLPSLDQKKIPRAFRNNVHESLSAFSDEVYRAAPISVIDRARDAVSQCLLAYFNLHGNDAQDLGALAKRLSQKEMVVAANAASIVARLHARAKPVERAKRPLRLIKEQDAQLATQCVGAILCELGWADWI